MPGPTDTDFFERAGLEDTKLGRAPKDDPRDVARDGFEAMMAGKDHVVAGSAKNKLLTAAGGCSPTRRPWPCTRSRVSPARDETTPATPTRPPTCNPLTSRRIGGGSLADE